MFITLKSFRLTSVLLWACWMAKADTIVVTYNPSGIVVPQTATICTGATVCTLGVEDFNSWTGGSFTTDFGTGNQITGVYSGGFHNYAADQYGGADGNGTYPEIFKRDGSYSVSLSTASTTPGVNYFGLWYSALDAGNLLQFFKVTTFCIRSLRLHLYLLLARVRHQTTSAEIRMPVFRSRHLRTVRIPRTYSMKTDILIKSCSPSLMVEGDSSRITIL